ncbi:MAG: DUF3870 domain-containing protein [Clostridia bacterium]|nr:DUF3870 domain-containing protein [Clostridia bacterium]
MDSNTILCVGYARLPEGITAEEVFKIFGVGLEIDPDSGVIVRCQTTCCTTLGDDFLSSIFVGKNMETEYKECLDQISRRYRAIGCKAILAAAKKAYAEYMEFKNQTNGLTTQLNTAANGQRNITIRQQNII